MTKPLSELIAESEPNTHLPESQFVDVASYIKLKSIAVELANACEEVSANGRVICLQLNEKDIIEFNKGNVQFLVSSLEIIADKGLTKARSILGGGNLG